MIRIACGLAILALLALLGMVIQTSGGTATLYAFVGIPALALAIIVYLGAEGGHVKRLLVRWLGGTSVMLFALGGAAPSTAAPPSDVDPAAAYSQLCASCHGPDGRGETPVGRAMKVPRLDREDVADESLIHTLRTNPKHKSVAASTDDDTLRVIANYLRSHIAADE